MWVLSNAYDGLTIVHYLERMWPNFMGIVVLWNGHCSVFQVEIIRLAFKWLIVLRSYENMWSNAPSPCHLKCAATTKCMLNPSGVKAACRVTEHGHPKRAELLGVNINTGVLSITTEEASLTNWCSCGCTGSNNQFECIEDWAMCLQIFTFFIWQYMYFSGKHPCEKVVENGLVNQLNNQY